MLGRNGVDVTISVLGAILLILVEGGPGALHVHELGFRSQVACLAVAAQPGVVHKGKFLAGTELVHHAPDVGLKGGLLLRVVRAGVGKGQGAHVVTAAVALELGVRGIPAVAFRIAFRGETVGVPVIVQLLGNVQGQQVADIHVPVAGEAVVANQLNIAQRQGLRHLCRGFPGAFHHGDGGLQRITVLGGVVTNYIAFHHVGAAHGQGGFLFLGFAEGIGPFYLAPLAGAIGIGHLDLPGQTGSRALRRFHRDGGHFLDGPCSFGGTAGCCQCSNKHYFG